MKLLPSSELIERYAPDTAFIPIHTVEKDKQLIEGQYKEMFILISNTAAFSFGQLGCYITNVELL